MQSASAQLLMLTGEPYSLQFENDEIRVVDHDNADEIRISDTLSGGETFLTSLALALVSETLQGLRVGGRMVGIITHIPELRDEFAQQVIVTKHQGFSTVEVRGASEG